MKKSKNLTFAKRALLVAACLNPLALLPFPAQAAEIKLVDNTNSTQGDFWVVTLGNAAYSPFTLTSSATVSSAIAYLQGSGVSPSDYFTKIVNNNGGSPGSTVFGTSSTGSGTLSGNTYDPISFGFSSPVNLSAGSYYLGLFGTDVGSLLWGSAIDTLTNTGTAGDATLGLYKNNTGFEGNQAYLFSLSGSTSAVPESSTLGLFFAGAVGFAALRRRKGVCQK